jgi:CO/xanthine dehydrogenase FAD-binding subunit
VIRANEAELFIASRINWPERILSDRGDIEEFANLVRAAARPIDDHRSTAQYRRHAVGTCAARALERMFTAGAETSMERAS